MIGIVQILSILFAVSLAKLNAPAVINFEDRGVSPKGMAQLHRYNVWVKTFFHCACAFILLALEWKMNISKAMADASVGGVLSFLWVYLIFDIALNLSRLDRKWDYIGENDGDGRRWIRWFGKNAGRVKALILFLLIIGINILFSIHNT